MNSSNDKRRLAPLVGLAISIAMATGIAAAGTISYNLTADPSGFSSGPGTTTNGINYIGYDSLLTNAYTGQQLVPDIILYQGDTINGTVSLSSPWTMPAGNAGNGINIDLQVGGYYILMNESFSFYNNSVQVFPAGYSNSAGSMDFLAFETGSSTPTPAFTFDQIDFSGYVNSIQDSTSFAYLISASLTSTAPSMHMAAFDPTAVPLPAAAWLFGSGLLGLTGIARRKKAM